MPLLKTILVCDDEASIRQVVATKLRGAGFEVFEARNGLEGYCFCDHAAVPAGSTPKHSVPLVPALVVTDLQMPLLSGLEMAQRLKQHQPTALVPVLMLTARGYILQPEELSKTNIRTLMPKPFGGRQLLDAVAALLGSDASSNAA
jgi:DNA-binding response OmpR family regulator